MPDFDDIPDLPVRSAGTTESSSDARLLQPQRASPTRLERSRRKWLALMVSVLWLLMQLGAFGLRGDLARLSPSYIVIAILAPLAAGCAALAVAGRSGALGLGSQLMLVTALAVLMPLTFVLAALLTPTPYSGGETGNLALGASCLDTVLLWALLPLGAAGLAFHGTFVVNAVWRSLLLGSGCGLLAAGLFALHCPLVGKLHIAAAHGGAVLLSACLGAAWLPRLTRI